MSAAEPNHQEPPNELFWRSLSSGDREALQSEAVSVTFAEGEFLFHQGDTPVSVYVVIAGQLKLVTTSTSGHEALIELRGPGSLIGEMGAIDGRPRSTASRAITTVEAWSISAHRFRNILQEYPTLSFAVLTSVTRRLRQSVERRSESSNANVRAQLCSRLLELASGLTPSADGSVSIRLALTQQELAEWLGVSRDAVVIALHDLRKVGLIETGRRRIRIIDPNGLAAGAFDGR